MSEIVRKIIEIDKEANEIVLIANEKAEHIVDEIDADEQKLKEYIYSKSEKNINKVKAHFKELVKEESLIIGQQKAEDFEKISKAFSENSEKWIDEIYQRITNNQNSKNS